MLSWGRLPPRQLFCALNRFCTPFGGILALVVAIHHFIYNVVLLFSNFRIFYGVFNHVQANSLIISTYVSIVAFLSSAHWGFKLMDLKK